MNMDQLMDLIEKYGEAYGDFVSSEAGSGDELGACRRLQDLWDKIEAAVAEIYELAGR